jgi:uncharacterized OB-fold protein
MGRISNLGKKLGHLYSESLIDVSASKCTNCGKAFTSKHEDCPTCGQNAVETIEETMPYWNLE